MGGLGGRAPQPQFTRAAALAVKIAPIDTRARDQVIASYRTWMQPALAEVAEGAGTTATCRPGVPAAREVAATLTVANYARALAGLRPVALSDAWSGKSQRAALIMDAQGRLSHDPPRDWACWSRGGHKAAGYSNLALGITGAHAVVAMLDDTAAYNRDVGHRRWLLDPRARRFGVGLTAHATAVWVVDPEPRSMPRRTPRFLPWPTPGYFPAPLEPGGRWSLSSRDGGTNLGRARVSVTGPNGRMPVTVRRPHRGYALDTLVWDVAGVNDHPVVDTTYRVRVRNLYRDGRRLDPVSYRVTLVSP